MSEFVSDIDNDLDVIFGEYRDHHTVKEFVQSVRTAKMKGTLYIGYPVLTIDDVRIEFDAVLISRDRGVIVFDLYSYQGGDTVSQDSPSIPQAIVSRQEQLYAAIYNKLNFFKELRKGRKLIVDITTVSIHPIKSQYILEDGAILLSLDHLIDLPILPADDQLDDVGVQHLNAAIQRISRITPAKKREQIKRGDSYGATIKAIEAQIANLDLWQKRGAIEYVNGPQRIRGLAGSGKTVVLALKAAYLHVKRPDWNIVVTFNTRSLYQQFEDLLTRFVYTQIDEKPNWDKLHVMHAWGNWEKPGVYSNTIKQIECSFRDFGTASRMFGSSNAFGGACTEALKALGTKDLNLYDVVLIDEAQDLPTSFFRLIYRLTKEPKRIVWAYDDLQNLGNYKMPGEIDLFGTDENGNPLVKLVNQADEPQQDIVLPRCYRNPPWTLVTAHGLGFGTACTEVLQMFPDPNIWRRLGYREYNGSLGFNHDVTVERDPKSIPDFFGKLLNPESSIQFKYFPDYVKQYQWIANEIKRLIDSEELEFTDFLIVIPNSYTSRSIGSQVITALRGEGLDGHLVGVTSSKDKLFINGSIAITHIHRAKGNEAPVVLVINAEYCSGEIEEKKRRNMLFTAITRSRAWTYVCGVGLDMKMLVTEFEAIHDANYRLKFHYPTHEALKLLSVSTEEIDQTASIPSGEEHKLQDILTKHWDDLPLTVQNELAEIMGPGS